MMRRSKTFFNARALPDATLRRLRVAPSYFFVVYRWGTWLYALIFIFSTPPENRNTQIFHTCTVLLIITFIQTLIATLIPIVQLSWPRRVMRLFARFGRSERLLADDDDADTLTPFLRISNPFWNFAIYSADVIICGLAIYFSAPLGGPPFGNGSPFYRYGFSTILVVAMTYRYWGGMLAALGYESFILLGILVPAPGSPPYTLNVIDAIGSFADAPLIALLAAYVATLIHNYTQTKRRNQASIRSQRALLDVSETIMSAASNRQKLLQKVSERLRQGGHFQRLVVALITANNDKQAHEVESCIETNVVDSTLPTRNPAYIEQVLQSGQKISSFEQFTTHQYGAYGVARLYFPLYKEGHISLILGAESRRKTAFDQKSEEFLAIAGNQLLIALDNLRLTEQTVQLAAEAERGRIARDIHDGLAQITYMMSLNAETSAMQAHRIIESSTHETSTLAPLVERLDRLVATSKQALWETRNYLFSLKPLMSGNTNLPQMLTNQVTEFKTISDLPVELVIETADNTDIHNTMDDEQARIGAAVFRIVQEALTNAYKHAGATRIWVHLQQTTENIDITIRDNGHGLPASFYEGTQQRLYSGRGVQGMHERASELGGTLDIENASEGGTRVHVNIPTAKTERAIAQ
jgi:signal transduction histidine kinase